MSSGEKVRGDLLIWDYARADVMCWTGDWSVGTESSKASRYGA